MHCGEGFREVKLEVSTGSRHSDTLGLVLGSVAAQPKLDWAHFQGLGELGVFEPDGRGKGTIV